jgi:hypothetical protein
MANVTYDGTDLTIADGTNLIPRGSGSESIEIGDAANASGSDSIAIGDGLEAGDGSIAIGANCPATSSVTLGGSGVEVNSATSINSSGIESANSIAIGSGSVVQATAEYSTVIGNGASVEENDDHSIALGANALPTTSQQICIGGSAVGVDEITALTFGDGAHGVTIANELTFGVFPITPSAAPDADYEVANKKYVDDNPYDYLSDLTNTVVSITGTATATISRQHICTGTVAGYTVTLPTVSGNTGKFISFHMDDALTVHVTLDGNGTEKICSVHGLDLTRVYVHGESVVLYCDGTVWQVVHETMQKLAFAARQITTPQNILSLTTTVVELNDVTFDTHNCFDSVTTYRYTPTAPGVYSFQVTSSLNNLPDGGELWGGIRKNAASRWTQSFGIGVAAAFGTQAYGVALYSLNGTTDYVECSIWNGDSVTRPTIVSGGQESRMSGYRVCREES